MNVFELVPCVMMSFLDQTTKTLLKSVSVRMYEFVNDYCDMFKEKRPNSLSLKLIMSGTCSLVDYTAKYCKHKMFLEYLIKYGNVNVIEKHWDKIKLETSILKLSIFNDITVVKYVQNRSKCFVNRSAYHDPYPTHNGVRAGKLENLKYLYSIKCLYVDDFSVMLASSQNTNDNANDVYEFVRKIL